MTIKIHVDNQVFAVSETDLEHLDLAIKRLRARHNYTAAERVGVVRAMVAAYLAEEVE